VACWIGHLQSTPVPGLASCELFGQPGGLDLLLPRLLTGEQLDRPLLRRLALGGLLKPGNTDVAERRHLAQCTRDMAVLTTFTQLDQNWQRVEQMALPNWPGTHDALTVYRSAHVVGMTRSSLRGAPFP
jgi:hypothetical protein